MNQDTWKKGKDRQISVLTLVLLFVSILSFFNIVLLVIQTFIPLLSICLSGIFLILLLVILKIKIVLKDKRFTWVFLIVVLVALFFRFSPNLYLTGGQDQGTYVSMSKQFEINHSLYIRDVFRESISKELQEIYDKSNKFLGLDIKDLETSEYVMPFYPVFPSWMATFGSTIGSDNRIYAMTFFSILSVIGVYLLGYEISGRNRKVGLLASSLIAINPLHVYFSRVPVTEIVALTFICFSLYFLVRFYNDYKRQNLKVFYLVMSLVLSTVLFYTRMSGIFFLPIIVLLPIVALLFSKDKLLFKILLGYSLVWILSLFISYMFYGYFLPDLYHQIIGKRVLKIISLETIGVISLFFIMISIVTYYVRGIQLFLKKILKFLSGYLHIFLLAIFFGTIIYGLSFYIKDILIENNFALLSNESLSALKQQSFLVGFLYLSPFGFLLVPFSIIYLQKKKDVRLYMFFLLIAIFILYYWGISRITQYHYYFARYQLSELIPFCIILLSIFLVDISKNKRWKVIVVSVISIMTIYFGYFSVIQLRDSEGLNNTMLEDIKETVGNSVLIVEREDFGSFNQIVFPLKYYYEIEIFPVKRIQKIEKYVNGEVYVLSKSETAPIKELSFVKEIKFKNNYFVHCNRSEDAYFEMEGHSEDIPFCKYMIIPNRYYYGTYTMYLYEWE